MVSNDCARVVVGMMMITAEMEVWSATGATCGGVLYIRNANARNQS